MVLSDSDHGSFAKCRQGVGVDSKEHVVPKCAIGDKQLYEALNVDSLSRSLQLVSLLHLPISHALSEGRVASDPLCEMLSSSHDGRLVDLVDQGLTQVCVDTKRVDHAIRFMSLPDCPICAGRPSIIADHFLDPARERRSRCEVKLMELVVQVHQSGVFRAALNHDVAPWLDCCVNQSSIEVGWHSVPIDAVDFFHPVSALEYAERAAESLSLARIGS